ncbi:MAG: tyrosine-type recombinase/integrase [Acidobacteria bacterium]|nr:tyrosine-type recombinase/integrase [Acidobacteriota bacterium]
MEREFQLFKREKQYVQNVSVNTLEFYQRAFNQFKKHIKVSELEKLKAIDLIELVASMREAGMSPACCDAHIRGINPFLTWCFENQITREHLKIKRVKFEQRVMKTFKDSQVKAIISYKPKDEIEKRMHVIMLLLLDTGIRINEALTLERCGIDFDNLLITVMGKGNKERIVPFSIELRKVLFKFVKTHKFDLIFCNRYGGKLRYDNMRRDLNSILGSLGITDLEGSFHAFRRCFATNYIRNNGNPLKLQRMLGHTTLAMTNKYVRLVSDDLSQEHQRTSILNRLR